ncbi:unnamed protein product [Paramecium sonneborni]|uniref:Uncharacterized protein n=1 Tax=Paramecium sonneborni TaxID=65129 RepID=A0A8S1MTB8_9CILI|nr:unnamed protein product [Paramecium sonneborni]
MRKSSSTFLLKSSFMSQRQTIPDIIQKIGLRFATQYEKQSIPDFNPSDSNQLELVRIKEKYKWKCEELDRTKQCIEQEQRNLEERANQLKKGEKEIRILTNQIIEKLNHLQLQEQQFKEKVKVFEEKLKVREEQFIVVQKQLDEQQNQLKIEKSKLELREKNLQEKEYLTDWKFKEAEQYLARLIYYIQNTNQKENQYHQQIDHLNLGLEKIIQDEQSIKNIEQNLSQQVISIKKVEQMLIDKIQSCKQQEQIFDQKDLNIQISEDLINRKLEWDYKQIVSAQNSIKSQFNFENSRMEISHFVHSTLSQNN